MNKLFSFASMAAPIALKPRLELTPQQLSLILGLEEVLAKTATSQPHHPGLRLICPKCAGSGRNDGDVRANNHPTDLTWKIDCDCHERRGSATNVSVMRGGGDLIALAQSVLKSAVLEVRCPTRRKDCRYAPLTIQHTGNLLLVKCGCTELKFSATASQFQ